MRRVSPATRLLLHGPHTRRGRLGAYLWNVSCAWYERSMPRPRLIRIVVRDVCTGRATSDWSRRPATRT